MASAKRDENLRTITVKLHDEETGAVVDEFTLQEQPKRPGSHYEWLFYADCAPVKVIGRVVFEPKFVTNPEKVSEYNPKIGRNVVNTRAEITLDLFGLLREAIAEIEADVHASAPRRKAVEYAASTAGFDAELLEAFPEILEDQRAAKRVLLRRYIAGMDAIYETLPPDAPGKRQALEDARRIDYEGTDTGREARQLLVKGTIAPAVATARYEQWRDRTPPSELAKAEAKRTWMTRHVRTLFFEEGEMVGGEVKTPSDCGARVTTGGTIWYWNDKARQYDFAPPRVYDQEAALKSGSKVPLPRLCTLNGPAPFARGDVVEVPVTMRFGMIQEKRAGANLDWARGCPLYLFRHGAYVPAAPAEAPTFRYAAREAELAATGRTTFGCAAAAAAPEPRSASPDPAAGAPPPAKRPRPGEPTTDEERELRDEP
jgi:hypothetical protein